MAILNKSKNNLSFVWKCYSSDQKRKIVINDTERTRPEGKNFDEININVDTLVCDDSNGFLDDDTMALENKKKK